MQEVAIPERMEGIIVLNIPSYGGGCDLWKVRTTGASASEEEEEDDDDPRNGHDEDLALPGERGSWPPVRRIPGVLTENNLFGHESDDDWDEEHELGDTFWGRAAEELHWRAPSMSDRLLEVVGVNGVLHLGTTQIGIGGATRLAQCSELSIKTSERLPLQVDGEPFEFEPGDITISTFNQCFMLQHSAESGGLSTAIDAVDHCMDNGTINAEQRNVVIREIARRGAQRRRTGMTRASSHATLQQVNSVGVLHR